MINREKDIQRGIISLEVIGRQMYAFIDRYFVDYFNSCLKLESSTEKEEKAIAAIKKEPIQVDQFLHKLRQKKLDKYLNFEVRVSSFYWHLQCSLCKQPSTITTFLGFT